MHLLQQDITLELNRQYQPLHSRTVGEALTLLYRGAVKAIEVDIVDDKPVMSNIHTWDTWVRLSPSDRFIVSSHGPVRAPLVITDTENDELPLVTLTLDLKGVYIRDRGIDQYTGLPVAYENASIDHIIPKSHFKNRADAHTWTNVCLCDKEVNRIKANRTPTEAGLRWPKARVPSPRVPMCVVVNHRRIREWGIIPQLAV